MATIAELLKAKEQDLTRAERQLASTILDNYPIPGLGSISELADLADVSTPTVVRMVQKIGLKGYSEFQQKLREELSRMISNPGDKRAEPTKDVPEGHILNRYAVGVYDNIRATLETMDLTEFDAFCEELSDPKRRFFIAGGRLSGTLAQNLFLHLQMIRSDVALIPSTGSWPHSILDMRAGDTLVVFDIRRYENATLMMAEMAHERGAEVVLFTDQWRSPIQKIASKTFAARIAVPSAWDSGVALLVLIESMIAKIQEDHWELVDARTEDLEAAFDRTRLFRKFT